MQPQGLIWRTRGRERGHAFNELTYPRNTVLHLGGMPGVGKSTLARRLLSETKPLSLDDILAELSPSKGERRLAPSLAFKELFARANARADADAASGSRSPLVVETTAGWESVRKDVLLLANAHQRPCHLLLLDASANVCARGRAQRERGFNPSKDVAEHYEYAWRQLLGDPERLLVEEGHRSVVVLDRRAANCLRAINFE